MSNFVDLQCQRHNIGNRSPGTNVVANPFLDFPLAFLIFLMGLKKCSLLGCETLSERFYLKFARLVSLADHIVEML